MPYKRHKPVSVDTMLNTRYENHHSICQTLREIYMETDPRKIKYKARLAMAMAKSMQKKLKAYKADLTDK